MHCMQFVLLVRMKLACQKRIDIGSPENRYFTEKCYIACNSYVREVGSAAAFIKIIHKPVSVEN